MEVRESIKGPKHLLLVYIARLSMAKKFYRHRRGL